MPLSEFHQATTKGKLESAQSKMTNSSSDLSTFMPDQEFVELLWENGQIVMQGQSNRPRKSSFINSVSSNTGRFHDRESRDAVIPKIAHFGATTDSMVNDFVPTVPSAPIGLNAQEDDMAPWMNYPIEDSLQNDYCSDFLSEFTGVHMNSHSAHNNAMPADRSNSFGQIVRDSQNVEHGHISKAQAGGTESSRVRTSQLFQLPQQCQSSVSSTKSKTVEFGIAGCFSTHQDPSGNLQDRSLQKQEVGTSKPPQPSSGMGLMNFSHFSRPVALVRSNLQSADRLRRQEKASPAASSNPMEYTVNNSASGSKSLLTIQGQSASIPPNMELRSSAKPPPEVVSVGQSGAICREDTCREKQINNITNANTKPPDPVNCQSSSAAADVSLVRHEIEKGPEAVVASSVCSVNSAGAESNDPKHTTKRKNREGEDSGYQSEDVEDGSVGVKKHGTTRGTSTKRSRAAEVHNLSERRRRDRINEKMRALQELIPNCNKVDKASMLDEAIEYLKTLQLQVQIMSMGSGLCMPPMMLPAGMQHLRPHPMAHFSPMGVNMGMGMGLGYGMGMLDMNGSPGCPLIPVQPMHGSQFPCPSMPGAPSLHGMMPGSTNLHMYGIPGQGLPVSMPRAMAFGSVSGLSAKVNTVPQISGATTTPLSVADTAPSSSSKDQEQQNIKLETKTSTSDSQIQTSTQVAKESFEQTTLLQMSNQTLHGSGN